jgi:hypothetical protein
MRSVIAWPAALSLVFFFANLYPPAHGTQARAGLAGTGSLSGWELAQARAGCQLDRLGESSPHRISSVQAYMAPDGDPDILKRVLSFLRRLHPARIS